jgi:hypothetical protein
MLVVGRSHKPFGFHSAGGGPLFENVFAVLQRENRRSIDYRLDRLQYSLAAVTTRPFHALDRVFGGVALAGKNNKYRTGPCQLHAYNGSASPNNRSFRGVWV